MGGEDRGQSNNILKKANDFNCPAWAGQEGHWLLSRALSAGQFCTGPEASVGLRVLSVKPAGKEGIGYCQL